MKTDKLKDLGWKIVYDTKRKIKDPTGINVFDFVNYSEEYVTWDDMIKRATIKNACLGLKDAIYILKFCKKTMEDWDKNSNIIFPGTIIKSRTEELLCPFLQYTNKKWEIDYHWLLYDFHHKDKFISNKT